MYQIILFKLQDGYVLEYLESMGVPVEYKYNEKLIAYFDSEDERMRHWKAISGITLHKPIPLDKLR